MMKHFYSLALLLGAMTAGTMTTVQAQSPRRISVHDPSIVIDSLSNPSRYIYRVYGSHLGHGFTYENRNYKDWYTWTQGLFADANGNTISDTLAYSNPAVTQFTDCNGNTVDLTFDAHAWQNKGFKVSGNEWAPDVIYNKKSKKWCMYMSLNGDHWCSSIVLFTSDKAAGPWVYQGPVVMSGFQGAFEHNGFAAADDWKKSDFAIATGETSLPARYKVDGQWGNYWPNCIDPCVFYDDDDNMWLSYGSWSGGIFMIRLDSNTGLRDYTYKFPYEVNGRAATPGSANRNCTSDPYFGKKIAGGYYVSGEGSYIKKIGGHWFLFLSYGGLNPSQGYQMRVFRADNPTGPYRDAYGTSAIYTNYRLNFGSNATDNRGVLLMGGYQWDSMPTGEVAQGHNSAFIDPEGREFVVYHTKFNDGTFGHQVRIHQMFLNQDGWLMAAPYEFNGETATDASIASKASISDSDIPGTYKFIRHQYNQSYAPVSSTNEATTATPETPVEISLTASGKVTGGESGTWTRTPGTDYITLTLSGVDYKGVLIEQTVDYENTKTLCIAALSSSSGSLTIGKNSFTRQQEVWASKTSNDVSESVLYPVSQEKNTTSAWWSNFSTQNYTLEQGKSLEFKFVNYSNKEANYKNWCLYGASATHGAANYTEYFGIRCDNWDNTTGSNTGCTSDFDWSTFTSDMDGSQVDMTTNYTADGDFTMTSTITTKGGKTYHYSYTKNIASKPSTITLFFVSEGSYIDGSSLATGIHGITAQKSADGKIYNLNGQQVSKCYRGLVICNGRKYFNK